MYAEVGEEDKNTEYTNHSKHSKCGSVRVVEVLVERGAEFDRE